MKNKIHLVCRGYFSSYRVTFKDKLYYVKVENDDFNNWELSIEDESFTKVNEDLYEEIENYLEEEKIL